MGLVSVDGYQSTLTISSNALPSPLLCLLQEANVYTNGEQLEADYVSGKIHPSDLKPSVTEAINLILEPVRVHFSSGEPKKLLDKIKKFKVTR